MSKKKQQINGGKCEIQEVLSNETSVSVVDKNQKVEKNSNPDNAELNENVINENKISDPLYDSEIVEERLEEAKEVDSPKKKKKSAIINAIFLIVNIGLMLFIVKSFLSSLGDTKNLPAVLAAQGNRLWWLAVGVLFYVVFVVTETAIFSTLIKGTTGKRRGYLSYRVGTIGKYYDNITPFSVGGQPFQIVALAKAGMSPGISTSLPIIKVIIYNIVYVIMILFSFIFGIPLVTSAQSGLGRFLMILFIAVAIIGFIVTILTSMLFILVGSGKIIGRGIARWAVKIGYSLRIVKNYRKTYNKFMLQVREYQNSMKFLRTNIGVMVKSFIYITIQFLAFFSIPAVCVLAFGNMSLTFEFWFVCFTKFLICQMAAVIIPLPGGTGMMEIGFILAFGSSTVLGDNVVWALLAWRIISYYLLLVHGFVQTIIDSSVKTYRSRKELKLQQKNSK